MKLRYPFLFSATAILTTLFAGCIKDDLDDCPPDTQGLQISFYSKTLCQLDTTYLDTVTNLWIGVFDQNDLLVSQQQKDTLIMSRNTTEIIAVNPGLYTVIAWSGIDSVSFDRRTLQNGVTSKKDLLFRLTRTDERASIPQNTALYHGESPAVYLDNNASEYTRTSVNMLETTNRLTITVEGLTEDATDYEIFIESNNGSMNLNGTVAPDATLVFESDLQSESGILHAEFTLLKLETGLDQMIVIRNKANQSELFRGSLLGTLLLKNPEVNLHCDHDFTIAFTAEDQCDCGTYILTEIWVNNWLVHSYDKEM